MALTKENTAWKAFLSFTLIFNFIIKSIGKKFYSHLNDCSIICYNTTKQYAVYMKRLPCVLYRQAIKIFFSSLNQLQNITTIWDERSKAFRKAGRDMTHDEIIQYYDYLIRLADVQMPLTK